jgi:hypothetical protein
MGTSNQSSLTSFGAARSFRRRTAWGWNVAPRIPVTGEVHDQIQVDGIYVGSWCCLIGVAGEHVLGWQWCDTEKKAAWAALLGRFPAPRDCLATPRRRSPGGSRWRTSRPVQGRLRGRFGQWPGPGGFRPAWRPGLR